MMKIKIRYDSFNSIKEYWILLELPAEEEQIFRGNNVHPEAVIVECPLMTKLEGIRINTTTINELNFFAQRLESLSKEQLAVMRAVFSQRVKGIRTGIRDLINLTYGLDEVNVITHVRCDEELGERLLKEDAIEELMEIPKELRHLLDRKLIGKTYRERETGVYVEDTYIAAGSYMFKQIYTGTNLPILQRNLSKTIEEQTM